MQTLRYVRYVIVNADDFGYSRGVNRGIVEAHEYGIVTSASLMVARPGAVEAAEYARGRPQLGLGLHAELGRWRVARFPVRGAAHSVAALQRSVATELARQLDRFRSLIGRDPSHLDSHQHRHRDELVRPHFELVAAELGVPLRRVSSTVRFCGEFYGHDGRGQPSPADIRPEALISLLEGLEEGVTELGCHPGYVDDLRDWYHREREQEVRTLCDPAVKETIGRLGIRLCTFADLRQHLQHQTG
jgi:chitin disaccharide deacetylase